MTVRARISAHQAGRYVLRAQAIPGEKGALLPDARESNVTLSAGDEKSMRKAVAAAVELSAGFVAVLTLLAVCGTKSLLHMINTPEDIFQNSYEYIVVIFGGMFTMMLYNLLGGAISFAEPSGLLSSYVTLTAHSMIWHMILVFIGLFLVFSGLGGRTAKDYRHSTYVFLLLCVVAFTINLVFRDVSGGSINMFFIGPSNTSIAVFKQVAKRFGWYVSTAVYIPAICLGAYLIMRVVRHVPLKKAIIK
jgi:hypothetical protein